MPRLSASAASIPEAQENIIKTSAGARAESGREKYENSGKGKFGLHLI